MGIPYHEQQELTPEELIQLENNRINLCDDIIRSCSNQLARESGTKVVEKRAAEVGQVVVRHNPVGIAHKALVTAVWSLNCINLVVVSSDEKKQDSCGRQIEHHTSQSHGAEMKVHGNYWRFEDEEPNAYVAPLAR